MDELQPIREQLAKQNKEINKLRSECRTFYVERFKELEARFTAFVEASKPRKHIKCSICSGEGKIKWTEHNKQGQVISISSLHCKSCDGWGMVEQ